jgi:hypothetical protein
MLGDIAGERRREVVAQGEPLLVVVLEREHPLVRAIEVGQELAERVRIFEEWGLDGFEPVELEDLTDRLEHPPRRGDLQRLTIGEPAGDAGLHSLGLFGGHGGTRGVAGAA